MLYLFVDSYEMVEQIELYMSINPFKIYLIINQKYPKMTLSESFLALRT